MSGADDPLGEWRRQIFFRLMYLEDVALADRDVDLDFTVESLRVVERAALERFDADAAESGLPDWSLVEAVATYLGETLMRLAGGAWGWQSDGAPDGPDGGQPVVGADPTLGLPSVLPLQAVMAAVEVGDGERFATLYRMWEQAVARVAGARPGWTPSKEPTMADSPPTDAARLDGWLAEREAGFGAWAARYGPDVAWDFSLESLTGLEEILRREFSSEEALHDPANRDFREAAAWYLGEVWRRSMGGHWVYDDVEGEHNYPYLDGLGPWESDSTPVHALEAALDQPGVLREVYDTFMT